MMPVLAMAPPVPLGGKLLVALLVFGLVLLLVRKIRGAPLTGQSIGVALAVAVVGVLTLEMVFEASHGGGLDDRGVLAAMMGALSAAFLLRPIRRIANRRSSAQAWLLIGTAFISGAFLGLALALLAMLASSDMTPSDRGHVLAVFVSLGMLADMIGAVVVAVASVSGFWWSSEPEERD